MWRISTHALTEGDGCIDRRRKVHEISTHALTEGDEICLRIYFSSSYFNSRPHGGRQHRAKKVRTRMNISTHALTEGDTFLVILILHFFHFNSRPHGGRPDLSTLCLSCQIFQLTPSRRATAGTPCTCPTVLFQLTPSRRATMLLLEDFLRDLISTHALTEGDAGRTG